MPYKDIKDIAADIRKQLKTKFPLCTFSVRVERYSMGQSLHVALMSAPFPAFSRPTTSTGHDNEGYAQLNHHGFRNPYGNDELLNNGHYLTQECWDTMTEADKIANGENWDNSRIEEDYFDVNYYLNLYIGKWDKRFEQVSSNVKNCLVMSKTVKEGGESMSIPRVVIWVEKGLISSILSDQPVEILKMDLDVQEEPSIENNIITIDNQLVDAAAFSCIQSPDVVDDYYKQGQKQILIKHGWLKPEEGS